MFFSGIDLSRKLFCQPAVLSLLSSAFIFQLPLEICNLPLASCLPLEISRLPPPANGGSPTQVIACKISSQLLQISNYPNIESGFSLIWTNTLFRPCNLFMCEPLNEVNHFVVLSIMKCHNTKCLRLRSVSISSAVERTEAIYFQASVLVEEVSQRKSVNHLFPSLAGWQDPLSLSQRLTTKVF